ncbi:AMP deaminase [Martiniozyma asiatica (nom. inval.)]|nr:AMP deaminase [Martiniozyma asiatica]
MNGSSDEELSEMECNPHFSYSEEQTLKEQDAKLRAFTLLSSPKNSRSSSTSSHLTHSASVTSHHALGHTHSTPTNSSMRRLSTVEFINPPPPPASSKKSKFSYNPLTNEMTPLNSGFKSRYSGDNMELDEEFADGMHNEQPTASGPAPLPVPAPAPAFKLGSLLSNDHNPQDSASPELIEIYKNIQWCLDTRDKYQTISVQKPEQNPKNKDDWNIYPDPPTPFWKAREKTVGSRTGELQDTSDVENDGAQEFNFEDCHIPGKDTSIDFIIDTSDIYQIVDNSNRKVLVKIPTIKDYYMDLERITSIASDGPTKSFAFKRLQYLEARWNLYYLLNDHEETTESKNNPHRDFYNVRKVDTHVHHSACMNQKHLLRFIKHKLRHSPDEEVILRDGKVLTLKQVFESLNLTAYDLSIDTLDMHAHRDTFHRFDKFNLKYNPMGESRLREIFLKTDNFIQGKFLAEITKEVFEDLESSKYQMAEYRISIYGRSIDEWDKLAAWVIDNKLFSHNVRWLIQVPRLYNIYKKGGVVRNFNDIIRNLFLPLFEVTQNPQSHPKLHVFLQRVIGFDSVDDESKTDRRYHKKFPAPSEWSSNENPPYSYYIYYLFANMASLNHWRQLRGFNTFVLRPHSGEAGDPEHLISAFLTSEGISHGILLRKLPFVQYLYYLTQIGVAMSPLSNNALFLAYDKNPFPSYFKRGLNITLSTDDPLQFSYTREPLIEEYSVAAQIWKLSNVDMCELAKNSVNMSGFEIGLKKQWLGDDYYNSAVTSDRPDEIKETWVKGNDVEKTNVPTIRMAYRWETWKTEMELVDYYATSSFKE